MQNGFKGKIGIVQRFTCKLETRDGMYCHSSLAGACFFESMEEYQKWLRDDSMEPKMSSREKEDYVPVEFK